MKKRRTSACRINNLIYLVMKIVWLFLIIINQVSQILMKNPLRSRVLLDLTHGIL